MEPFALFLVIVVGAMALFGIPAVGFMIGLYASPDGKKPPMTMRIIDYSGLRHGGSVKTRFVKYHPKTGHWATPYDSPVAHGLVRVIEKRGLFGFRQEELTWEAARVQLPEDKKHGYGTYCADLLQLEMQERLDRLEHENSDLYLKLNEASNTLQVLGRNVQDEVERQVETRMKELQKMLPMTAPRRPGQGGR